MSEKKTSHRVDWEVRMRNELKWCRNLRPQKNPGVGLKTRGNIEEQEKTVSAPQDPNRFCWRWILFQIPFILASANFCSSLLGLLKLSLLVAIGTSMLRPWSPSLDLKNMIIAQIGPTCPSEFRTALWKGVLQEPFSGLNIDGPNKLHILK